MVSGYLASHTYSIHLNQFSHSADGSSMVIYNVTFHFMKKPKSLDVVMLLNVKTVK
jgi:hypothetical protein